MKRATTKRRGAIAPLTAILLVFLIGMVAFAVDTGWMVLSQTNLQNAADASALAGANPLMSAYVQYSVSTSSSTKTTILNAAMASARANAKLYAGYNSAGGVKSLALNDSDVEFGFTDAKNNYTPAPTFTGFPNTIKVRLRLDSQANQPLNLFFGPVLGTKTSSLNAIAAATIYGGQVNSFSTNGNVGLLPITYDVNHWNSFVATGQSPDGTTQNDANGVPQLQVYPSVKFSGNFGQLSLSNSHVGESTESGWVQNGASPSDIQALISANLIPLANHPANTWDWQGDTGFKASLVMTINNYVGQTFMLPLFTPVNAGTAANNYSDYQAGTGNGSHYYYDIVQFVAVTIQQPSSSNRQVVVQPAAMIEPNAILNPATIAPVGTSSQLVTTFTTPKLTQ